MGGESLSVAGSVDDYLVTAVARDGVIEDAPKHSGYFITLTEPHASSIFIFVDTRVIEQSEACNMGLWTVDPFDVGEAVCHIASTPILEVCQGSP